MKKTYVLDTNILLQNPTALFAFKENKVVITEAVLEELDNFKQHKNDLGVNARATIRSLEKLRQQGKLTEGIKLNDLGGELVVETNHVDVKLPPNWDGKKADNRLIQVCKALQGKGEDVHLVTNDMNERIKGDIQNITCESFETDRVKNLDSQYTGRIEVFISEKDFNAFYANGEIPANIIMTQYEENGECIQLEETLYPNEYILLKNDSGKGTALAKVSKDCKKLIKLQYADYNPYGIQARNVGQKFMIDALMSDCDLVILKGSAGTAKTLLSLAVGLEKVIEHKEYRKILVCRPAVTMGEDIGALPGTEEEKIAPYMRPIYDNLEILVDTNEKERYDNEVELSNKVQSLFEYSYIDTEACGFLRGRSIAHQYLIVDEFQNTSITQAKAIVTRAGEGTKIILTGDPDQIDTPFLDSTNNGLSWICEKMKNSPMVAQVTALKSECVRSKLAEEAVKYLS